MTRTMTLLLLALLALAPVGLAAEGDTNLTNLVLSGDLSVGDDATVTGDLTVSGTQTASGHLTLADTKDLLCAADGGCDIGASGTEFGTGWISTIDDGDGTVTIAAATALQGTATVTGNVAPEADGTRSLGASGTEWGTAWVSILDDGDGTVNIDANVAGVGTLASGTHTVTGNILPEADGTRDSGAAATAWADVFGKDGDFDELYNTAGTGAPAFPQGFTLAVDKDLANSGRLTFGAGVAEVISSSAIATITNSLLEITDVTANLDCIDDTGIADGTLLILRNPGGANTVTVRDNQSCTPPQEPLQIGAATRALVGSASLMVIRDATADEFHEVSFAGNN